MLRCVQPQPGLSDQALDGDTLLLGRLTPGLQAPLVGVHLPSLSRKHVMVSTLPDGRVCARDVSSGSGAAHGVFVNGVALRRGEDHQLRDGDLVTLGPPRLLVSTGERQDNPWTFQYHEAPLQLPPLPPAPETGRTVQDDLLEMYRCPVCLDLAAHAVSPPCGHVFCGACVAVWITDRRGRVCRKACPSCNQLFSALVQRRDVDELLGRWVVRGLAEDEQEGYRLRTRRGRQLVTEEMHMSQDVLYEKLIHLHEHLDLLSEVARESGHNIEAHLSSLRRAMDRLQPVQALASGEEAPVGDEIGFNEEAPVLQNETPVQPVHPGAGPLRRSSRSYKPVQRWRPF